MMEETKKQRVAQKALQEQEIREGAPFAAISYVLFLWLITFLLKKDNEFAHYHARQGLVIFIGELVLPFFVLIPIVGASIYRIGLIVALCVSLYGIYASLTGKLCRIPVVTDISSKLVV